jgi:hypothetical protein
VQIGLRTNPASLNIVYVIPCQKNTDGGPNVSRCHKNTDGGPNIVDLATHMAKYQPVLTKVQFEKFLKSS